MIVSKCVLPGKNAKLCDIGVCPGEYDTSLFLSREESCKRGKTYR